MERHTDNVQDLLGNAVSGVTVTVRRHDDSTLASIFEDDGVTGKANPFTNDSDGEFFFYAPNDTYDIVLSGPVSETRLAVELFDKDNALIRGPVLVGSAAGPTALTLGQAVIVDVTSNAVTLTLPDPATATFQFPDIVVQHVQGDIATNNITVQRNGNDIGGVAADIVMTIPNQALRFMWAGSAIGWAVQNVGVSTGGAQISGTPANNQVGVWVDATDIEGASDLTWDGTDLVAGGDLVDLDNSGSNTLTTLRARNSQGGVSVEVIAGGNMRIGQLASGGTFEEEWITGDRNGTVALRNNGTEVARTLANTAGGFEVDNQSTGGGFERVLTTSDLPSAQSIQDIKTADETVTNSTTYQNDDHISLAIPVGRWEMRGFARWNPPTGVAGIKFRWSLSGGSTGTFSDWGVIFREDLVSSPSTPAISYSSIDGVTGLLCPQVNGNAAVIGFFSGQNEVLTSTRTHTLQWAQNTADATGTTLRENSWWKAEVADN